MDSFLQEVLARETEQALSKEEAAQAHRTLGVKLKNRLPKGVTQYQFMSSYFGRPITSFTQIRKSEIDQLWRELGRFHPSEEGEA